MPTPCRAPGRMVVSSTAEPRERPMTKAHVQLMVGNVITMLRHIGCGASSAGRRFLAALHESRRKRAAVELARHRHLWEQQAGMIVRLDTRDESGAARTASWRADSAFSSLRH